MATNLSFGYVVPDTGDLGSVFFPILEDNIEQLAEHDHDGINSAQLSPASLSTTGFTSTITSGTWTNDGGGNFSKSVTAPAGVTEVNNFDIHFYNASGNRLYLGFTRTSATTYTVLINEDITVTAVYR